MTGDFGAWWDKGITPVRCECDDLVNGCERCRPKPRTMPAHVLAEAERLYHYDPVFHAQVERTVALIDADLHRMTGMRLDENDRYLAGHAATVALTVARMFTDG